MQISSLKLRFFFQQPDVHVMAHCKVVRVKGDFKDQIMQVNKVKYLNSARRKSSMKLNFCFGSVILKGGLLHSLEDRGLWWEQFQASYIRPSLIGSY